MKKIYRIIEVIILGVIFFGLIAPVSIFCRFIRKDLLGLKLHGAQKSYWIEQPRVDWTAEDFHTQFVKKRTY